MISTCFLFTQNCETFTGPNTDPCVDSRGSFLLYWNAEALGASSRAKQIALAQEVDGVESSSAMTEDGVLGLMFTMKTTS